MTVETFFTIALAIAWQGSLIILGFGLLMRMAPRSLPAAERHRAWCAVLAVSVVFPAVAAGVRTSSVHAATPSAANAIVAPPGIRQQTAASLHLTNSSVANVSRGSPVPHVEHSIDVAPPSRDATGTVSNSAIGSLLQTLFGSGVQHSFQARAQFLTVALLCWALLALFGIVRIARGLRAIRALRMRSPVLGGDVARALRRDVDHLSGITLLASGEVGVPVVLGFSARAIVFPESMLASLSPAQLRHVTLHELAHLSRRDDWTTLMLRLAQSLLWPLPAVHYAARRIQLEQEMACDALVVAQLQSPFHDYAESLVRVGELALRQRRFRGAQLLPSAATQLSTRIRALLLGDATHAARPISGVRRLALGAPLLFAVTLLSAFAPALTVERSQSRPTNHATPVVAMSRDTNGAKRETAMASAPDSNHANRRIVIPHVPVAAKDVSASDSLAALIATLSTGSTRDRAASAYGLTAYRNRALQALPALLVQLADTTPVKREAGNTSVAWWDGDDRTMTSPSEEAAKTLLFAGRGALAPVEQFKSGLTGSALRRAEWVIGLLSRFD